MAKINLDEVPETSLKELARTVKGGLDGFYADPENRKRFEEWKKAREADGKKKC